MTAFDNFFSSFNHDGVVDIRYYTLKPLTLTRNTCAHGSLLNPLYVSAAAAAVVLVVVAFDLFYFVSFWYVYYNCSLTLTYCYNTNIIGTCVKLTIALTRRRRFSGFSYIIWFETTADASTRFFGNFFPLLDSYRTSQTMQVRTDAQSTYSIFFLRK